MKAIRIIGLALALAVVSPAAPQAENPELRKTAQQFYRKWDAAIAKADLKSLKAMFHTGFTQIDAEGTVFSYADVMSQFDAMMGAAKDTKSVITVDKVEGTKQEFSAWVTMVATWKQKSGDRYVAMKLTNKYVETIVWTKDGYKFKMSQQLPRDYGK